MPTSWVLWGGGAAMLALTVWALAERVEVYRQAAEIAKIERERDVADAAAVHNADAAQAWRESYDLAVKEAEDLRVARDDAAARADAAEDAAAAAARDAEKEVVAYVQDIARIPMPCGLVRVLDAAADDSPGTGAGDRRARMSAAAGCAGKTDADLSRLGFDRLVAGFLWLAEDRRAAKARAAELSAWVARFWRAERVTGR